MAAEYDVEKHYQIEKRLAAKLRSANKEERKTLYSELYNELFSLVPGHPLLQRKMDDARTAKRVANELIDLDAYLDQSMVYMEIGPGDCAVAFEVAKHVKRVIAVDVSEEITKTGRPPANFELVISDGTSIPVDSESVDLVYSNQLMEHLHPDDAFEQLKNIYNALKKGGRYLCATPNRLTGPHDVSQFFDDVATGLHLQEYSATELIHLFGRVGFDGFVAFFRLGHRVIKCPIPVLLAYEFLLSLLPAQLRRKLVAWKVFGKILDVRLVAQK